MQYIIKTYLVFYWVLNLNQNTAKTGDDTSKKPYPDFGWKFFYILGCTGRVAQMLCTNTVMLPCIEHFRLRAVIKFKTTENIPGPFQAAGEEWMWGMLFIHIVLTPHIYPDFLLSYFSLTFSTQEWSKYHF